MNLLLIGAGQLGSRHLQSCLKYEKKFNIYVVDNSEVSLKLSEERAQEIENNAEHKVHFVTSLSMIDETSFDYLIIATGASVRFKILEEVLSLFSIKYAILEKVLFQDLQSYADAKQLINKHNVTAFVNCPLRVYPFFKDVKQKYISNKNNTTLEYVGGEWIGLACNSIHYIDLLSFLSGEKIQCINISQLDEGVVESKRVGNVEFTGTLKASYDSGANLSIEAVKGSERDSVIQIMNGDFRIIINEISGKYKVYEKDVLVEDSNYDILYQSDLSHKMIGQISKTGTCELIGFDESVALHLDFIDKLLSHYNKFLNKTTSTLPIT